MDLLNGSYTYLIVFIFAAVACLVVLFWIPFIIIVSTENCGGIIAVLDTSPNGTSTHTSGCLPQIEGAITVWDAYALAFASLFSVPTRYTPNSATAVTLVTIEVAVGKLAVAGLTALLVIKVSRVPNNLVLSQFLLVSKPHDHWVVTLRVGMLHHQTMSGCNVRLTVVKKDFMSGAFRDYDCAFESSKHSSGFLALSNEPIDFRHVIDKNSPLYDVDLNKDGIRALRKVVLAFIVSLHGFDDTTGRSLGIERRYTFDRYNKNGGYVVLKARGYLADVVYRLSAAQVRRTGAKHSLALQWPNFNTIKERSKGKKRMTIAMKRPTGRNDDDRIGDDTGGGYRSSLPSSSSDHSPDGSSPDADVLALDPEELAHKIVQLDKDLSSGIQEDTHDKQRGKLLRDSTVLMLQTEIEESHGGDAELSDEMLKKRSKHADRVHEKWVREHPDLARKKYVLLTRKLSTQLEQENMAAAVTSPYLGEGK